MARVFHIVGKQEDSTRTKSTDVVVSVHRINPNTVGIWYEPQYGGGEGEMVRLTLPLKELRDNLRNFEW